MMGNALVARLFYSLRKRNVPILFDAADRRPRRRRGRRHRRAVCASAARRSSSRRARAWCWRPAATRTTRRCARRFMPQPVPAHSMSHARQYRRRRRTSAAGSARASRRRACASGLWAPVSITTRRDGSKGLFPHLMLDRAKPGLIAVNAAGRRFVNEAASYHDFVAGDVREPQDRADDAGLADLRRRLHQELRPRRRLSRPPRHVESFVERRLPRQRADARGARRARSTSMRRNCAKPSRATTALPKPASMSTSARARPSSTVSTAMPATSRTRASAASKCRRSTPSPCGPPTSRSAPDLKTDDDARVLDAEGKPIAGLYACGNDMASVMGGSYPGPGTTLGPAIVFAYRAVMHARGKSDLNRSAG